MNWTFIGKDVTFSSPQWGQVIWSLILAAIWFWVAAGFWNVRAYAWSFGIFISLFTLIFGFFAILGSATLEEEFVGMFLALLIFMYLNYPGVQQHFVQHEMSLDDARAAGRSRADAERPGGDGRRFDAGRFDARGHASGRSADDQSSACAACGVAPFTRPALRRTGAKTSLGRPILIWGSVSWCLGVAGSRSGGEWTIRIAIYRVRRLRRGAVARDRRQDPASAGPSQRPAAAGTSPSTMLLAATSAAASGRSSVASSHSMPGSARNHVRWRRARAALRWASSAIAASRSSAPSMTAQASR